MKIKFLLSLFLVSFAFFQGVALALSVPRDFSDVPPSHPNYQAIMYFKDLGIIEGFSDGIYRPNDLINRVGSLKIILLGSNIPVATVTGTGGFTDTDPMAWYAKYIITGVQRGIVNGYSDLTFKPTKTLNLVEGLKMVLQAQNIDVSKVVPPKNSYATAWFARYFEYAKEKNLIGIGYPAQGMTRGRLAEVMYRLTFIQKNKLDAYPKTLPPIQPPPFVASTLSLKVVGNHLVDADEKTVRIMGVNRSGTEFECIQQGKPNSLGWGLFDGPIDLASAQAIASWHANVVRIPLNEDCWLGINGVNLQQWGGIVYQNAIKTYVNTLHQAGLYVILDLHWTSPGDFPALAQQPLPDADHSIDFWTSVATSFKDDQGVVFDLFNEPFFFGNYAKDPNQNAWDCWLNGCPLNQYVTGGQPFTATYDWQTVGMQTLVDTVRATGAINVVMTGGLEWSNDLTQWLAHKPVDPLNNLAAGWHSYPGQTCSNEACWNSVVLPIAAQVPIITGETGDKVCSKADYVPNFLKWANDNGLSYLGWTWNTWGNCEFVLIKDYNGTPTTNYGQAFHDLLLSTNP